MGKGKDTGEHRKDGEGGRGGGKKGGEKGAVLGEERGGESRSHHGHF